MARRCVTSAYVCTSICGKAKKKGALMINSLEGKSLTSVCLWQCCCFSHQITSTAQIARSTSPLTHFTTGSDRGRQVMRNRKG